MTPGCDTECKCKGGNQYRCSNSVCANDEVCTAVKDGNFECKEQTGWWKNTECFMITSNHVIFFYFRF